MNSLEFIKQHVTEWPSDAKHVMLWRDGRVGFSNPITSPYHIVDLSEHFAPDYYDGKVWTREEFEARSSCTVIDWNNAPSWATSYGTVPPCKHPIWYNHEQYMYIYAKGKTSDVFDFSKSLMLTVEDVIHHSHRPTPSVEQQQDDLDDGKKYEAVIIGLCGTAVKIDIYRVLDAYPQVDPHIEHLIKKALKPGERGHKDKRTDYLNIIESAQKALILLDQKERLNHE